VAVAGNSANQGLAVEWLKLLTGVEIQTRLAKQGGVIPNQEGAFVGHEGNPFLQVADRAATVSRFTPVAPTWGNVESSGILPDMLEQILSGTATIEQATAAASEALTATLNG
jgi:N,N'-diacetylchitobiose transport system substrate-binding protein